MRARLILALILLAAPIVDSAAQRLPRPRRGAFPPAGLPPQAPPVARDLAYRRMPYSVESYPFISHHDAGGFLTHRGGSSWLSGGFGERLDYRFAPMMSATLDVTSSFLRSPVRTETAELGLRFRPDRDTRRVYPFVDVRFGYMQAFQSQFRPFDVSDPFGGGTPGPGSRSSRGWGAMGGLGMEYALTRMLSLTTGASALRTRMRSNAFLSAQDDVRYWMTTYRYTLGLRFNPVRAVNPPVPPYPAMASP